MGVLTALVEKSLVVHTLSDRGQGRYRLLETERQYAGEELEKSGQEEEVRDRHLDHVLSVCEEAKEELQGTDQATWLARLDPDHENIQEGLRWAFRRPETIGKAARICNAVWYYWERRSTLRTGLGWLDRVLDALASPAAADGSLSGVDQESAPRLRAEILFAAGFLTYRQDEYERARALIEESRQIARSFGLGTAEHTRFLGMIAARQAKHAEARVLLEESLSAYRAAGDRRGELGAVVGLANLAITEGDYESARSAYRQLLDRSAAPSPSELALISGNYSYVSHYIGEFQEALDYADQALQIARSAGLRMEEARANINAGRALHYLGRFEEAEARLRGAVAQTREIRLPFYQTFATNYLLALLLETASPRWNEMEVLYREGLSLATANAMRHAEVAFLSLGARIALGNRQQDRALERSSQAVRILEPLRCIEGIEEEIYWTHSQILSAAGRPDESRAYLEKAYQEMMAKADLFRDPRLRSVFLSELPVNREIRRARIETPPAR